MNTNSITAATMAARNCAMQMMFNADYIQDELPNLQLEDALRAPIENLCSTLIGTKQDVMTEVFEIDELLQGAEPDEAHIMRKIDFIVSMIQSDLAEMHKVATILEEAASRHADGGGYLLVAESAVNILNGYNNLMDAKSLLIRADAVPAAEGADAETQSP